MTNVNPTKLEILRVSMHLSVGYLAKLLGIPQHKYIDYATNPNTKVKLNATQINQLAQVFGVKPEFLIQKHQRLTSDEQALLDLNVFQKRLGRRIAAK